MSEQTEAFYNRFSGLYPLVDAFLKPQKKVLFDEVNRLAKGRLLEIGVGNGKHLTLYKKHEVTAIDTSVAMLNHARKLGVKNVRLYHMDGQATPFKDNQFDYVLLSHVIAVVDNPDKLLLEVLRVMQPHGQVFILNHFTPDNWLKYVDYLFDPVATIFRFKSTFRIESIEAISKFKLVKQQRFGFASYFKLLIYQPK